MKPKTIKQLQEEIKKLERNMEICSVARDLDKIYRLNSDAKATLKQTELIKKAVGEVVKEWWQDSLMFQMDDINLENKGMLMISEVELKQSREELKTKLQEVFEG